MEQEYQKNNIVFFLLGQTISLFGSNLVQYAIFWHITLQTQSGQMMTLYILCGFLPTFVVSPFGGVWADRFNRKRLIVLADSGIALSTLALVILYAYGYQHIYLLLVMSAIRAFGTGIHTPAIGAVVPQLVPQDKLTFVNGLYSSIQSAVMLLAPLIAAVLISAVPLETIFLIDVITAILGISMLLFLVSIPTHHKALDTTKVRYAQDLKEGFYYISRHAYLKRFFLFSAIFFFFISPLAFLTPLQMVRSYGEEIWRLMALEITFSAGMMAGGLLMASWGGFRNKIHTMALATFVVGIGTLALGMKPLFLLYLAIMVVHGITLPLFNTPATVLLQTQVEEAYRGRVFGVFGMIHSSMMPVGMLLFGPLADWISIELLLWGTGIILFGMGFFLLKSKVMLAVGE